MLVGEVSVELVSGENWAADFFFIFGATYGRFLLRFAAGCAAVDACGLLARLYLAFAFFAITSWNNLKKIELTNLYKTRILKSNKFC